MAAVNMKPATCILLFLVYIHAVCSIRNDEFAEELYIKSLKEGYVLNHFHFTTRWNSSITDPETFTHYRLFPKALGDVLSKYKVQELHLSQTQGLWKSEMWGYAPQDAPPGTELWVWFQPQAGNIEDVWPQLVNALSGLFCASLNFMDSKLTVLPRWSFRPAGLASHYYSFDSRFMRYAALPGEIVCTENLTPWTKLLPCESQAGLGSLFKAMKLYDSQYHSLGVHVRPVCQDTECRRAGVELKQTLSVVVRPKSDVNPGFQNWSFKGMFGQTLHDTCQVATRSQLFVDTSLHQKNSSLLSLNPEQDETVRFRRGGVKQVFAVYDLKKHTAGNLPFNLHGTYSSRTKYGDVMAPPFYAHRYITGYGLEKGGIMCIITNELDTNLTVIYMETIPWYLRVYFNSITIETNELKTKPYKVHYVPGKDRVRPTQLELAFRVRPQSVTTISMEFDRAFLKWTEYPPDANHGFYINAAVVSTVLPTGEQYTAIPQNGSSFADSMTDSADQFFLRLHTETLLVSLPTPDFSMPYNVICLACTVVAIAFGSLHNLTTRSFVAVDPKKRKPNLLQKLKSKIFGSKEVATGDKTEIKAKTDETSEQKDLDTKSSEKS